MKSDQYTAEEMPVPLRPSGITYENNTQTFKARRRAFVLSWVEPKTHAAGLREALIWCLEVFTVVQYGDQMCIMNVHNHECEVIHSLSVD